MSNNQSFQHLLPKKALTKNTIILDIDETLVNTKEDMKSLDKMGVLSIPGLSSEVYFLSLDNGETEMWGTKRPHLDEFLLFCFTNFDNVCVWSAGQRDYVHGMVDILFEPFRKPDIVFTFDDCVQNEQGDWVKPLDKMFEHPEAQGKMHPHTTFIVDDREYTFESNEPNGILIPPYSPSTLQQIQKEDDHLSRLKFWFLHPETRFVDDVRSLNKNQIFTQKVDHYTSQLQQLYGSEGSSSEGSSERFNVSVR